MEQYVGLDVSLKETSLCVVDQTGTTLWQGKCASTPECIAAVLARRAHLERPGSALRAGCCRPGTGTRSKRWVCRSSAWMRAMPRQPYRCGSTRRMPMMPKGSPRSCAPAGTARCRSRASTTTSSGRYWAARAGLVAMHRDVANQIRGALKTFGLVLGKVAAGAFEARVRQLIGSNPLLAEVIEALLKGCLPRCQRHRRRHSLPATIITSAATQTRQPSDHAYRKETPRWFTDRRQGTGFVTLSRT